MLFVAEGPVMSAGSSHLLRALQAGLVLVLIVAPLPFGSVQDDWIFQIEFAMGLLLGLWILHEVMNGRIRMAKMRLYWVILALLAYLLVTLAPLPPFALGILSREGLNLQQFARNTIATHGHQAGSWFPISLAPFETKGEVLKIASYALFFFLVLELFRHGSSARVLYVVLVVFGTSMAVFGLVQNMWSNGKIYWRFESGSGTPFGPFVNHNHFAGYLELTLGLSLGMFVAEVGRFREQHPAGGATRWIWHKDGARPWVLLICSFFMIISLTASLSRGGMLSVLATSVVFAAAAIFPVPRARARRRRSYGRVLVLAGLSAIVLLIGILALSPRVRPRWEGAFDEAAEYRVEVWRDSLGALRDFPVTGAGLGSFRSLYPRYKSGNFTSETTHAENDYIQWTMETGFLGLALLVLIASTFARHVVHRLKKRKDIYSRSLAYGALFSISTMSFHNFMDFNMHIPSNALTMVCVAALCFLVVNIHGGRHGAQFLTEVRHISLKSARGVIVLVALLLAAGFFVQQVWTHHQSLRSMDHWSRSSFYLHGDPEESQFALLNEAIRQGSWNDRAYFAKAMAYESAGEAGGIAGIFKKNQMLEQASKAILEAIRRRPAEALYWAALGRIESGLMNEEQSDQAFRHALNLARTNGWIHRDYGLSLLYRGDIQQGSTELALARHYIPNVNLREFLTLLAKYTDAPGVWENLVYHTAEDQKIYADFLASRGLNELAAKIRKELQVLQTSPSPNPR